MECIGPLGILNSRRMDYGGDEVSKALPLVADELEPGPPDKEFAAKIPAISLCARQRWLTGCRTLMLDCFLRSSCRRSRQKPSCTLIDKNGRSLES